MFRLAFHLPCHADGDYIGCFSYGCLQIERDMSLQPGFTNTPDNCTNACQQDGYHYAGLHNMSQCMCSRTKPCYEKDQGDIFCGITCKHDSNKFCGGMGYMSIYNGMFTRYFLGTFVYLDTRLNGKNLFRQMLLMLNYGKKTKKERYKFRPSSFEFVLLLMFHVNKNLDLKHRRTEFMVSFVFLFIIPQFNKSKCPYIISWTRSYIQFWMIKWS